MAQVNLEALSAFWEAVSEAIWDEIMSDKTSEKNNLIFQRMRNSRNTPIYRGKNQVRWNQEKIAHTAVMFLKKIKQAQSHMNKQEF